ncbi:carcinoembryonic antigen-related cell adhesion molecule 1-like [Pseudophryne corroboree]|uniref:carcinoembryonic antigen-related cell adhesion molecule 1-like n=1 Tax=Pseudophryne corroboree TaxID=495146 RepID=UPI0030816DFC
MGLYKCVLPSMLMLLMGVVVPGAVDAQVVNGALGGSVYLDVTFTFQPNTIIWNFIMANGTRIPVANLQSSGTIHYFGHYLGRCELYMNGSLRLDNITHTDQGEYSVAAQNADLTEFGTKQLQLYIYVSLTDPDLVVNASDGLIDGKNVTLHCNAGNQNVSSYVFHKDKENVCSKPHVTCRGAFLDFQPITGNDTGTYTCTIQNPVSTRTSNSVHIFVTVPVSGVNLTSNASDSLVWPGITSVSLSCSSGGTNVSFSWSLQGAPLPLDHRYYLTENNSTLIISPVSANDNGTFTCTASNSVSNSTSNGVTLTLASPVSAVMLSSNTSGFLWVGDDSVSLHCSAQGSTITFSWTLNGELLDGTQHPSYTITQGSSPPYSNLTISPVSRKDNGSFTCTGSNLLNNETSHALSLDLAWSPEGNIQCLAQPYGQRLQILQLSCSWPGGQPVANVTMIFDNETETNHDKVIRNVTSLTNVQGSNLTCNGDQLGRTSSCTLPLEPPQSPGHNNSANTTVTEGQTAVMNVSLTAGPQNRASAPTYKVLPAEFSWYYPNHTVINNGSRVIVISTAYTSSLQITDVTADENGKYECRANNLIGNTTFIFTLHVAAKATPPPPSLASKGLDGGAIAGIVIGVLAGVTIILVILFFIFKKKKQNKESIRMNDPDYQTGAKLPSVKFNKENGDTAEASFTNNLQDDGEIKYARIEFKNTPSTKLTNEEPEETLYSDVKKSNKQ